MGAGFWTPLRTLKCGKRVPFSCLLHDFSLKGMYFCGCNKGNVFSSACNFQSSVCGDINYDDCNHMSLCRLSYPGLEITQFLVHLILMIIKFSSTSTHKRGVLVVKTLAHRAKTVVSEKEDRRKELDHLRGALKRNGYLEWILRDLKEENNSDSEKGDQGKQWKHP